MLVFFVVPVRLRAKYVGWLVVGGAVVMWACHFMPDIAHVAHLGGCLVGWIYARQLGFGNPWWIQRRLMERRQREERLNRMSPDQYMTEEIDPILDKDRPGRHPLADPAASAASWSAAAIRFPRRIRTFPSGELDRARRGWSPRPGACPHGAGSSFAGVAGGFSTA